MTTHGFRCAAAVSAALLGPVHASALPPYHAIVLGIADGRNTLQVANGVDLNRWGQVLGNYGDGQSGGTHAVLWSPAFANDGSGVGGTLFPIETSAGMPTGTASTFPSSLNDRGQVVGVAYTPGHGDGNQLQSWMWRPTTLNSINGTLHGAAGSTTTFALIGGFSAANGQRINNKGVIAAGAFTHPTLWTPTTPNAVTGSWTTDPGPAGAPAALNDFGQFVGSTCSGVPWNGPYRHQGPLPMTSTDTITSNLWLSPNGPTCVGGASSINALGDVVIGAASATKNVIDVYLFKKGVVTDLNPGNGGSGNAINRFDQIVGSIDTDTRRAALIENGSLLDLNLLNDSTNNLFLRSALAINDAGQILIQGQYPGAGAPTLLTPFALVTNPVQVTVSPPRISGTTYSIDVSVTNLGSTAIVGPVSLALDGLTPGVSLTNSAGVTFYTGPGSHYADVSPGALAAGATTPTFTLVFANPKLKSIVFKGRVLGSTAPR